MPESTEKPKRIELKETIEEIGKTVAMLGMYFLNHHIPVGLEGGKLKTVSVTDPITTSQQLKYMSSGAYRGQSFSMYVNPDTRHFDRDETKYSSSRILLLSKLEKEKKLNLIDKIELKLLEYYKNSARGGFEVIDSSYRSKDLISNVDFNLDLPLIGTINLAVEVSNDNLPFIGTVVAGSVAIAAEIPVLREFTPYNSKQHPTGPNNWNEIDWGDIISDLVGILASGGLSLLIVKLSIWEVEKLEALLKFLNKDN